MNTSADPGQVAGSSSHPRPAGERWHNGKRLELLADLAQQLAERRDLSPWDAARELLEHLAGRPEPLQLYAAPDGTEGRPVPVDHVWRAAVSGRPAFRDHFADVRAGRGRASPVVPERQAVAELRGMAGLFELLNAAAPKHGGLHKALRLRLPGFAGPLALALDDAEAMLARLIATDDAQVTELSVVPTAGQAPTSEQLAPLRDFNAGKWRDADRRRFGEVYALAKRTMKKAVALDALAETGWANSGATLQKRITEANELEGKARKIA
jgi:hypothetical protein